MVLSSCFERDCFSIDIGSNLGLLSFRMLQQGSRVLAFEPQADLACASEATARYNGYQDVCRGPFQCIP